MLPPKQPSLTGRSQDTSYAFEHPFATRLTITMVVLLHISGPLTILLRPHIFDIIAWKLQTAILPRLQLDIENFCRDVRDFTSLLHGVTAAHGELQIIKSALQKHGKVTLHLGQGQITEVVKVETPFEPSFARKRLRMLILESNVRFEGEDSIRREASIWEYLAQFPEPHPHFATLRATHSDESPPFFDYRPVGEMDLGAWLQHHYNISSQDDIFKPTLLGWFGCVQSVMVHLHEVNHVLHCDIKPNNFIISSNLLYLIDHSLSRVLTKESGYTSSERIEVSKYTAPEGKYKMQKVSRDVLTLSQ